MEFYLTGQSLHDKVPWRFDAFEPEKVWEKPSEELGNYEWFLESFKLIPPSDVLELPEIQQKLVEKKLPKISVDYSSVISFEEFLAFLVMNYRGWAPYAKGMSEEKATAHANKLIRAFLSCDPTEAVYVRYAYRDGLPICGADLNLGYEPMFVNGIIGVFDLKNFDFFKLIMGGYDAKNVSCCGKIEALTSPPISLCPIRKIPIEFNAFEVQKFNQGTKEELGNYQWYLYQYRFEKDAITKNLIQTDQILRNNIPAVGQFKSSGVISFEEFLAFLVMNYRGWAPYAKGMSEEKATTYANKFIRAFLSCDPKEAMYVKYSEGKNISSPFLISGVMGVFDFKNNEFFELVMGGTD